MITSAVNHEVIDRRLTKHIHLFPNRQQAETKSKSEGCVKSGSDRKRGFFNLRIGQHGKINATSRNQAEREPTRAVLIPQN